MATVKWSGAPTSRSSVLTTELNSLANGAFSAAGPAYDNTTNLDRWGWVEFVSGGSITPTAGAYINVYLDVSQDGTNYEDPASSTNPASHALVATIMLKTGAHTVRASHPIPFPLPPGKFKFVAKDGAGVALSASGNTLTLYTSNESVA